jgi:hypothetical protein
MAADLFYGNHIVFEKIFNKNNNLSSDSVTAAQASPTLVADDAAHLAREHALPDISADELQAWQQRIRTAASDDAALLQLAQQAPTIPLKLAAIEALTRENSFKQAMHDFREYDKRLYRAAKSRWDTASGRRLTADEARSLIASARALLEQEIVPANYVVDLDRAWAALNSELLDAALAGEFAALSEQLGGRVRAVGARAQALTRWLSATDNAIEKLRATLMGVAQGEAPVAESEVLALSLLELVQGMPEAGAARCMQKADAANRLLAQASSVVERAKFLQALPAETGAGGEASEKLMIEQWRAFPEMADGNANEWHTVLATRFADWRNASTRERQLEHDAQSAQERERRTEQNKQRLSALQRDVEAAETAQAAGQVAELTRLLVVIEHAVKRGAVNAALTLRIELLRSEQRRLQDWQRWSGGQGREQLALEAQVLATAAAGKVAIKAHAEAIDKLRERWKELDKLGGASSQSVWLAFDGALKTAYAPVAAHLDKLKLAREENLAAREKIVADLAQAVAKFFPVAQEGIPAEGKPDWRAVSHTLDDAQLAWRKLGPVEHTVPRKALKGDKAVTTRYAAAVQALEAPLKNAYGDARRQREQLIASAKELAAADVSARDVVDKVRRVQTQWQAVAKAMPLPRRDENALWTAFKTATDSIFTARDAARAVSEAEFAAKLKAREEVIARVAALSAMTAAADIKRAMAEADSAWRACDEAPKSHAAKLDARYRGARDVATKRLGELATHAAQARYDALIAKMALCDEREKLLDAQDSNGTLSEEQAIDLESRWNAVEHLPDAWKSKLDARCSGAGASAAAPAAKPGKHADENVLDILLNLEVACGMDTPAEFLAARQHLKIRALKNAMEGRQTALTTPADIERWLLDAAAHPRPDDSSRVRLAKIIAAVRVRRSG